MRTLITLLFCSLSTLLFAQPALELTTILSAGSLSQPVDIQPAGDGSERLFIAEKAGRIKVVDLPAQTLLPGNFLNISSQVRNAGEAGFLGFEFHPDFENNGQFFVNYSSNGSAPGVSSGDNIISRFTLPSPDAENANDATEEILLVIEQPFGNHNGGDLAFGPDGYLYIGTGDGGSGGDPLGAGQDNQKLLGKMLRIDVNSTTGDLPYGIPADNPFVNDDSVLNEIWATGLRNPWRYSFDRETGDLWIGDVGQNAREEINFEAADSEGGLNYGWNCREGLIAFGSPDDACSSTGNYVDPVADMPHSGSAAAFSITGGYRYRGGKWPELQGTYICADFVTDIAFTIVEDENGDWNMMSQNGLSINGVTSFGESNAGELYLVDFSGQLAQVGGGMPSSTRDIFATAHFNVSVSPNPASSQLSVNVSALSGEEVLQVRLIDMNGRRVLSQVWSLAGDTHQRDIHLPNVPAGVYRLLVTGNSGGRVVPVVIK